MLARIEGRNSVGRKPIPVELKRSERACAMFTKAEIKKIEAWMEKQSIQVTLSDAVRALVLQSLEK